ncbi:hypothetical protein GLE_3388 [Lysobacter enzymogenes]|uniref:Uncharacterized protein n=1 Tax=Lysobacter enzymogenes TaxID=69 RepID=A0A0S2DJN1_LYSEN|nr:hypothetical protein GLE_3388 [Lysobacter enzymogenes]
MQVEMNEGSGHAYRFCGRAGGSSCRASRALAAGARDGSRHGGESAGLQGISPAPWGKA